MVILEKANREMRPGGKSRNSDHEYCDHLVCNSVHDAQDELRREPGTSDEQRRGAEVFRTPSHLICELHRHGRHDHDCSRESGVHPAPSERGLTTAFLRYVRCSGHCTSVANGMRRHLAVVETEPGRGSDRSNPRRRR